MVTPQINRLLLQQVPKLAVMPLNLVLLFLVPLGSAAQLLVLLLVLEETFRIYGTNRRPV